MLGGTLVSKLILENKRMRFDVPGMKLRLNNITGSRCVFASITLNLIDVRWIDCTHDHLHGNIL